jgi:hypothetical protein
MLSTYTSCERFNPTDISPQRPLQICYTFATKEGLNTRCDLSRETLFQVPTSNVVPSALSLRGSISIYTAAFSEVYWVYNSRFVSMFSSTPFFPFVAHSPAPVPLSLLPPKLAVRPRFVAPPVEFLFVLYWVLELYCDLGPRSADTCFSYAGEFCRSSVYR